jgi:hypothetical protein
MRKIFLFICISILIPLLNVKGQEFYISGGMGYNMVTMEKLNDYLHYNWNFRNRRDQTHSAIEFYGLIGTTLLPNVSVETSFGYTLNSFTNNYGLGVYEFEYVFYIPELNFLYDLNYGYYGFQAGFGIGYILGSANETQPMTIQKITETTKGFAFNLKSTFYASLSYTLQAEVGMSYRQAFMSDLMFDNFIITQQHNEQLNLSFNSFGIKLGMRYRF